MKKLTALVLIGLAAATCVQAQTPYSKKYQGSNQNSVEGTLDAAGRRTGNWVWYYQNGRVSQRGAYNAGNKTGTWTFFYEDGSRMAEECHTTGVNRKWFRNGDLHSEVNIVDGRPDGTFRSWYDNGQLEEEIVYVNGSREGQTSQWHRNGKLRFRGEYRNNELQGQATWWTETGSKDMEGLMVDGEQEGLWRFYWRTNGKLGIEGNYSKGKETGV